MKALVLTGPRRLEVQERDVDALKPNEVLVRVEACGICGSDVHGYDGSTGRRIPPLIMGHEASGSIADLGAGVTGWHTGDRVAIDSTLNCARCDWCRAGQTNLCDNRRVLGVSCDDYRCDGAFAEYVAVPGHVLHGLPDSVGFADGALIEPLSVAVHAVRRSGPTVDRDVLVLGAGMIGALIVQALRAQGCGRIVVADLDERRLETARQLGADFALSPSHDDVVGACRDLTRGRGVDLAIEAVGYEATITTAIRALRKGGQLTLVGNLSASVNLPLQEIVTRELGLAGSCASSGEYTACIALLAEGRIDLAPLISATATLDEGPAWFDRLYEAEPGLMKIVLEPGR